MQDRVRGEIDPHELRRLSVILRRLLTDGTPDLLRAWRLVGLEPKHPRIKAARLHNEVRIYDGAGNCDGSNEGLDAISVVMPPRHQGRVITRHTSMSGFNQFPPARTEADMPLHEYLDSCGLIVFGNNIKRRHIINFMANKKGGAHLDRGRRKDEGAYILLDSVQDPQPMRVGEYSFDGSFRIGDKTEAYKYFETVAIEIADAPDVQKFIAAAAPYRS